MQKLITISVKAISVISVMVKAFKRIIYNQLYAHLLEHDLLSKHQSGFRSLHSTVAALLVATGSWAGLQY